MIGILIVSHGKTAEGLYDSLGMFFGNEIEKVEYLCFASDLDVDNFGNKMDEKISALDDGDGVLIFADLKGGTPGNLALLRVNEKIKVVFGVNLPILMEAIGLRMFGAININNIVQIGKDSILSNDDILEMNSNFNDEDEL